MLSPSSFFPRVPVGYFFCGILLTVCVLQWLIIRICSRVPRLPVRGGSGFLFLPRCAVFVEQIVSFAIPTIRDTCFVLTTPFQQRGFLYFPSFYHLCRSVLLRARRVCAFASLVSMSARVFVYFFVHGIWSPFCVLVLVLLLLGMV